MNAQAELDSAIDDLLSRWHSWRSGYTVDRGFRDRDSTCSEAQSQWTYHDRLNGVYDEHIEQTIMHAVDRAVDRIPDHPRQWHMLILMEARNLWAGHAVWSSIRLPTGEEFEVLRMEARNKLALELRREGCIGG